METGPYSFELLAHAAARPDVSSIREALDRMFRRHGAPEPQWEFVHVRSEDGSVEELPMPRSWSPGMQPLPGMIALLRKLTVRTHEGPTFTFAETISAEDYVKAGNTIRREYVTFQRPPTSGDASETAEGAAA